VFEKRGDGAASGPPEVSSERVKGGPLGAGERDGERAAALVASHELSGTGLLVFVEELVAVVLVGDHDEVAERVSLLGEVADSLSEIEGKGQPDFVARLVAAGRGRLMPMTGCAVAPGRLRPTTVSNAN